VLCNRCEHSFQSNGAILEVAQQDARVATTARWMRSCSLYETVVILMVAMVDSGRKVHKEVQDTVPVTRYQ